jgi:P-type E1-E2 ATPase
MLFVTGCCCSHAAGHWVEVQKRWTDIKVGDVLKVKDNELFPADLLCLHCELDERICFVKTTNLDGETNLKVKRCAASLVWQPPGFGKLSHEP